MSKFQSISEMCKAIILRHTKGIEDERLIKSTGQNEATNADGGYLVNPEILPPLLSAIQQGSVILPKCRMFNTVSYAVKLPMVAETTRKTADAGNFNTFWVSEGVAKTPDKVAFNAATLKMHKLVALMYTTDELMQDAALFNSFVDNFITEKLAWEIDRAILLGDGNTSMYGIMGPGPNQGVVGVTEINPLNEATLLNYFKALAPAATKNAEWYMSKENFNDILDITFSEDNVLIHVDGISYLYGMKVNVMEQMYGNCHDLLLGDFGQYAVVMRSDTKKNINISIKFLEDEQILRWVIRLNGSSFGGAYTLEDNTEVGTFVVPACSPAMASSSSSSSSSIDSSSSSSSSSMSSSSESSFSSHSYPSSISSSSSDSSDGR